jgi:DNA polymerase IV
MARWILHADMDAFYASIEQRDDPSLRGRPVIVGAQSGRGVVAAASYEARRFGVRSAMPGFRARELCPEGVFLPSAMAKYAAVSAQIQALFAGFTPLVEPLALDEAFLDISGSAHLFGGPLALARELKRRVAEETRLCVSVGVAPNKLVAKIACSLAKPDGLKLVDAASLRAVLDPLPIGWLWGVGPVLEQQLVSAGITTFAALATHDPGALQALIGPRAAELSALARGEDERPVEADRPPKSYGEENTFEQDVTDRRVIEDALYAHADAVARRLRHDGYAGRTVTLKVKLARAVAGRASARGPFYPIASRSRTLPAPTSDGGVIGKVACELFQVAALEQPVRLLGVSLSGLEWLGEGVRAPAQLSLFAPKERTPLGPALDAITRRFGAGAIRRAVDAPGKITHGRGIKRGESQ